MKKYYIIFTLLLFITLSAKAQENISNGQNKATTTQNVTDDPTWKRGFSTTIEGSYLMWDGEGFSSGVLMGYRINKYLFVGGGVKYFQWTMYKSLYETEQEWGRAYWGKEEWGSTYYAIPIYQTFKVYTSKRRFAPFIRFDAGVDLIQSDAYLSSQLGFDIKLGKKQRTALIYGAGFQLLDGNTPKTLGNYFITGFFNAGLQF